jgi:hypothetical protein
MNILRINIFSGITLINIKHVSSSSVMLLFYRPLEVSDGSKQNVTA